MSTTTIRRGNDAVELVTEVAEVKIRFGRDGISGTIYLDWGEAREMAETILVDFAEMSTPDDPRLSAVVGRQLKGKVKGRHQA